MAREFRLLNARKAPLTKTNGETRTRYEPGLGALRRKRIASPPNYRAGTVNPLTTATQRRQSPSRVAASSSVFGSMIRELVAHAGDDPDDARDRGEEREEPEGLRAVEAGEARTAMTWAKVVPVTSLRTSVANAEGLDGGMSCFTDWRDADN